MQRRNGSWLLKLTGLTTYPTILKQQVDWPFEDSLIASVRWRHLGEVGKLPPGCSMFFKSIVFPIPRIQASRNEGLEMSYSDSWWSTRKICVSCFCNFGLCLSGDLNSKRWMLPMGTTIIPLSCKLRLSPGHFLMPQWTTRKESCYYIGWDDWSRPLRNNRVATPQWG